ncbi:MAG: hypothetical protein PHD06_09860 [Bacteroidales bacterium]|jgi:H+/Cl- antiporter ClcA|nr:hypothetical protein [Bacteroidales bacterium]MDD4385466.1 hypothetical protein [Bacteroidales bacterium]MDY0196428.1 hypothetical protein [Tenuifilaceae bacterium]
MNAKSRKKSKTTLAYIVIAILILVIILFFWGGDGLRGTSIGRSIGYSQWDWTQIIISLIIGFALGWLVCKRKRTR